MRILLSLAAMLCALSGFAICQQPKPAFLCAARIEACQEIDRLEVEWNIINELSDPDGKEHILSTDSYHVGPSGRLYNKAGDVATARWVRDRRSPGTILKFDISEKWIRIYKDVAIVTGYGRSVVLEDAKKRVGTPFRFVHVWEKRGGKWVLTVDQVTAVRGPIVMPERKEID